MKSAPQFAIGGLLALQAIATLGACNPDVGIGEDVRHELRERVLAFEITLNELDLRLRDGTLDEGIRSALCEEFMATAGIADLAFDEFLVGDYEEIEDLRPQVTVLHETASAICPFDPPESLDTIPAAVDRAREVIRTRLSTLGFFDPAQRSSARPCGQAKIAEILEPATAEKGTVLLNCSATLPPGAIVTKNILIQGKEATGVTLDCSGSRIEPPGGGDNLLIRSRQLADGTWSVPEGVTARNCGLKGAIRVHGMAVNGEGELLRESSRMSNHTIRARLAAPRNILLQNLDVVAKGRIPLYLSPGTTFVTFRDSRISGEGTATAVYLDAESAYHSLVNNTFSMISTEKEREQIAVDGSAYNVIADNRFLSPGDGGIFLYRNCGEEGTVRHQSPVYNWIVRNEFRYGSVRDEPAVWIASRGPFRGYCREDKGYDFGSSVTNLDLAKYNTVAMNRFYGADPGDMIVVDETPNFVRENVRVE